MLAEPNSVPTLVIVKLLLSISVSLASTSTKIGDASSCIAALSATAMGASLTGIIMRVAIALL